MKTDYKQLNAFSLTVKRILKHCKQIKHFVVNKHKRVTCSLINKAFIQLRESNFTCLIKHIFGDPDVIWTKRIIKRAGLT